MYLSFTQHKMQRWEIVNSKDWSKATWNEYIKSRFDAMSTAPARVQAERDRWLADLQWTALEWYDEDMNIQMNVKLEKALEDTFCWRWDGKFNYDILPDWKEADYTELIPSKYAMAFFLDWNWKDNRRAEKSMFLRYWCRYGTAFLDTNIRSYTEERYRIKEDKKDEVDTIEDSQNKNNYEKYSYTTNYFFPKAVHPRMVYVDEMALSSPNVQDAEDIIRYEYITKLELVKRRWDNKNFDLSGISEKENENPKNENEQASNTLGILLQTYYNRITKDHVIRCVWDNKVIYAGKYLYEDGKLPLAHSQHYTNINSLYGEWQPARVRYLKAFKSEMLQSILYGAQLNSSIQFVVGNDGNVSQDMSFGGRKVNVWRTDGDVSTQRFQQITPQYNLAYFQNVMLIIDNLVIEETGENPKSIFEVASDKVGIVEMMEQSKAIRQKAVDGNYNIAFDDALTMMLWRVRQFAPALESEKVKDKDGKILNIIFPRITVNNHVVQKNWKGKYRFVESLGKLWYFELKPEIIRGIGVKVSTPSSALWLPIFEREKVNGFIDNVTKILNIAFSTQNPDVIKEAMAMFNIQEIKSMLYLAYWYDKQGMDVKTARSEKFQKAQEKLKEIEEKITSLVPQTPMDSLQSNIEQNGWADQATNQGTPEEQQAIPNMAMADMMVTQWQGWRV